MLIIWHAYTFARHAVQEGPFSAHLHQRGATHARLKSAGDRKGRRGTTEGIFGQHVTYGCWRAVHGLGRLRLSMTVSGVGTHFAAEYPVGPGGVHKDDRQQEQRTDQQEGLRPGQGRRLPQGQLIRHDHRK